MAAPEVFCPYLTKADCALVKRFGPDICGSCSSNSSRQSADEQAATPKEPQKPEKGK